jgi:hypothetical protein
MTICVVTRLLVTLVPAQNDIRNIKVLPVAPRKRGSRATAESLRPWIPAFAGTTDELLI